MESGTAFAIASLRQTNPDLARLVHPATYNGIDWYPEAKNTADYKKLIGWHEWKLAGVHQLGLFGERRGPKGGVPWKRKRSPWHVVTFLNGARCASPSTIQRELDAGLSLERDGGPPC